MDLIRNSNSQFPITVTNPENASSTKTSKYSDENSSQTSVEIGTNNVIETSVDVEVKATDKTIACIVKKNENNLSKDSIMNIDCKNKKEKHETTLAVNETKCDINAFLRILERLRNNNSVSIIKINGNRTTDPNKGKNNENKHNNKQSQDVTIELINNSNTKVMAAASTFVPQIGNNTNKNLAHNSTSNVVLDSGIVNGQNVAEASEVINTIHSGPTKNSNNNSEMHMKDQTTKCLKEFDDILAEVLGKCDFKLDDTESLSLDEIDDILHGELKDLDGSYNLQHNKCPTNTIGSNKEDNIVNDSNHTVVRYILETVMTRLHSEIASKVTINGTNFISITSDVTPSADDKRDREIENISISSEDKNRGSDDECGYNSSDFEFISEEEAKVDAFKINFKSFSSVDYNASKFDGFQNDPYGAGPSSRDTESRDYENRDKVITKKSDMEHYAVPQEHEILNMFQHIIPGVPLHELHFLENKSVRTRAPMLIQYEGVGFDMNLFAMQRGESSNAEYKDEAEETLKKIFQMYPGDNTEWKRRRRY